MEGTSPSFGDEEKVAVEVRSSTGALLRSYEASAAETRAAPLLMRARERIAAGDPNNALALVLQAVEQTQGEGAIMGVLDQARASFHEQKNRELEEEEKVRAAAEKRAREAQDKQGEQDTAILCSQGRDAVLRGAYFDGSSVLCPSCGALIPRSRSEAHFTKWCPALDNSDDDD